VNGKMKKIWKAEPLNVLSSNVIRLLGLRLHQIGSGLPSYRGAAAAGVHVDRL